MLEFGDPPMGVASGIFIPEPGYSSIRAQCCDNHVDQSSLALAVKTEAGKVIPCIGVSVLEYSWEYEPPYIEVNVLGIEYPLYDELFPNHVLRYKQTLT
jgi:hypothetical protein